jgi:TolB protein
VKPLIKRKTQSLVTLILLGLGLVSGSAHAVLNIEITQGVEGAVPIAIVPFAWDRGPMASAPQLPPQDIAAVVTADLKRTGRFDPLPPKDMVAKPHADSTINFGNWRVFQTESLLVGTVKYLGADRYKISYRLFDVFKGKQMLGFSLSASGTALRRAAHQVSNMVYEKLTGEPGAFDTSVAYVTAEGVGKERRYSLWVADADGYNAQPMARSREPILSPDWSPDGTHLAYASLEDAGHQVIYVQDVASGRRELVSSQKGLNGAPAWSPDGKSLALSLSKDGNAEIYIIDLSSKRLRRITRHWAIDTEPVWTPDGSSIIFTSDRGGQPQLYRSFIDGGRAKRLTFEGKYNARASVSPDGKSLAMVHRDNGHFRVAVMDLETGNLRVLSDGELDESPSFAPNGSMIIYATNSGMKGVLAAVSIDGRVRQRLSVQEGDVREPAWSPLMK